LIPFTEQYLVRKFEISQDEASLAYLQQNFARSLTLGFELAEKFDSEDAALNTVLEVNLHGTEQHKVDIEIRFLCSFRTNHIRPSLDELHYMAKYSLSKIHEILIAEFAKRKLHVVINGFPFRDEHIRIGLVKELNEVYPHGKNRI
jgi:hypothetical protein